MTSQTTTPARSSFRPASRKQRHLRMAIDGPSGAGKTYTALRLAFQLGDRVAVICSEHGSAELYQGEAPDGKPWEFAICPLSTFSPTEYTAKIEEAAQYGFDCIVVDSLSHAWNGPDGALDLVDKKGGNKFTAWKDVTPMHRRMVEAILRCPAHIICTMRSKTEYVLELDPVKGQVPRKVGMAPIQREGMEYEFDVYGSMDWSHIMTVTKSRCSAVDGLSVHKPGPAFIEPVRRWLLAGEAVEMPKFTPIIVPSTEVEKIVDMLGELGRDLAKEKQAIFRRYSVPEFNQLTVDQARDYALRLQKDLEKKRKEKPSNGTASNGLPAGATSQAPANVGESQTLQEAMATSPGAPVAVEDLKPDAACDPILLQKLAAERELLFATKGLNHTPEHKPERDKAWKTILAKRNVTSATQLTNAQAVELLASMQKAVNAAHEAKNGSTEKK